MNFRPELADAVMAGRKTETRRALSTNPRSPWHPDAPWPAGKRFAVCPGRSKPNIGHARVITARVVQLGRLTLEEARAEGFASVAEFEETWRALHAGEYDERARVWRVEFEVHRG